MSAFSASEPTSTPRSIPAHVQLEDSLLFCGTNKTKIHQTRGREDSDLHSVSCFDKAKLRTSFGPGNGGCMVSRDVRSLFTGTINGGIYILDTQPETPCITTTELDNPPANPWHQRLGHIYYEYMKQLLLNISTPNDLCNTCNLAKHKRASHRKSPPQRTTQPFKLLH